MLLKYLNEEGYLNLYDGAESNLESYRTNDNTFLEQYNQFVKESRIDANLPKLNAEDGDFANIIVFYENFKDRITPRQACNPYLWSYLSHFEYWDYSSERWISNRSTVESIKKRFFCGSEKGSKNGFMSNSVARLWWTGYLTYDETENDHYKYTRILMRSQDLWQSLVFRKYSMCKEELIGILKGVEEYELSGENVNLDMWRDLASFINRRNMVSVMEILSRDEVKCLVLKYLNENYRSKAK